MNTHHQLRVILTRTAISHMQRFMMMTQNLDEELREDIPEDYAAKLRLARSTYKEQLAGAMAAVRGIAKASGITLPPSAQLKSTARQRLSAEQRRAKA